MSWKYVTIERAGPIATVRFDRGERLNAFDRRLTEELTAAALGFHGDVETRAVVLTGTETAFSSGADLKEAPEAGEFVAQRARFHLGRHMCRAWEEMPQTTVAAIEGLAVGGGVAITLACDWRVMGRSAYLYVPEVKVGLTLQWQSIPRLVALVGPARAKRIVMLCEKMGAEQALNWGLIEEIADDGGAVAKAVELASAAAEMPQVITTMSKQAINATAHALLHATSFMDADVSMLVRNADEARRIWSEFAGGDEN